MLGLWSFTNLELAYAVLRVDERLRLYAIASLTNVLLTIAASVVLVVGLHDGARGLLLGNYGASTVVLLGLWWTMRRRLWPRHATRRADGGAAALRPAHRPRRGVGVRAQHRRSLSTSTTTAARRWRACTRSPLKLAGAVAFIVRAFQYAWPPLAYSVTDDAEAARLYGLVTTYYVLVAGWVVAGLALLGRWVVRLLAAPSFFGAYRALPWVALGWALYGLWVVFLVIAGRAKITTRNFPAAIAGLAANVILILVLVPSLGIAGAGVALCGAYVVMLAVMYLLTRKAFRVQFEWLRLAQVVLVMGGLAAAGDLVLPTHGVLGLLTRALVLAAMPPLLLATGFAHPAELRQLRTLLARVRRPYPPAAGSDSAGERRAG